MQKEVIVSIPKDNTHQINYQSLVDMLTQHNIPYSIIQTFREKQIQSGLYHKEFDLAIMPLVTIPVKLMDGVCIAAVTGRESQEQHFVANPKQMKLEDLSNMKQELILGYDSEMMQHQFSALFPNVNHVLLQNSELRDMETLEDSKYGGVIVNGNSLLFQQLQENNHPTKKLALNEIIPLPGSGVVGYMCRMDDINVRSILKKIHTSEVSEKTNIERKVMSRFKEREHVACYVYKDQNGFFHAHAVCQHPSKKLSKITVSQSTTHGMADEIVNQLNVEQ